MVQMEVQIAPYLHHDLHQKWCKLHKWFASFWCKLHNGFAPNLVQFAPLICTIFGANCTRYLHHFWCKLHNRFAPILCYCCNFSNSCGANRFLHGANTWCNLHQKWCKSGVRFAPNLVQIHYAICTKMVQITCAICTFFGANHGANMVQFAPAFAPFWCKSWCKYGAICTSICTILVQIMVQIRCNLHIHLHHFGATHGANMVQFAPPFAPVWWNSWCNHNVFYKKKYSAFVKNWFFGGGAVVGCVVSDIILAQVDDKDVGGLVCLAARPKLKCQEPKPKGPSSIPTVLYTFSHNVAKTVWHEIDSLSTSPVCAHIDVMSDWFLVKGPCSNPTRLYIVSRNVAKMVWHRVVFLCQHPLSCAHNVFVILVYFVPDTSSLGLFCREFL